jgi:DnaJ-class molecular chaperone
MKPTTTTENKIILCEACNGDEETVREPTDLGDESYVKVTCSTCNGSGRLRVEITTITQPYVKA